MSAIIFLAQRNAVEERCSRIVRQTLRLGGVKPVDRETNLHTELEADSIDMVTIAMSAEEEFGIEVPDDVAAEIVTLGDMADAVERLIAEQRP